MRISDWSSDVCSSDLELPETLIEAFISAEDKTFFSHGGLDYPGIVSAVIDNLTSNKRPRGASTITQQVAKNLLLTNELSYTRKIREAILARRIEGARSEEHTSELQSLMRNSYAVFCLKKKKRQKPPF